MGHVIFMILHFMAILFGFVFLFLTIPLHLIFCVIEGNNPNNKKVNYSKNCPFCNELIHRDAIICRYCDKEIDK